MSNKERCIRCTKRTIPDPPENAPYEKYLCEVCRADWEKYNPVEKKNEDHEELLHLADWYGSDEALKPYIETIFSDIASEINSGGVKTQIPVMLKNGYTEADIEKIFEVYWGNDSDR